MIISKEKIESYIPQRAPFIMVDNLLEARHEKFKTDFTILPDNIFLEDGTLREYALIENIAQSSAMGLAVTANISKTKPTDGYIAGISKLQVHALPNVNDTINTVVTLLYKFENMYLLRGVNYLNDKMLLECEIKLVGI